MDDSKNSELFTFGKIENNEDSDSEESSYDSADENSVSEERAAEISSKIDEDQQQLVKEMKRLTSTVPSTSSYVSSSGSNGVYKSRNYNDRSPTQDDDIKLPSEVTEKEYIYMPPTSEEIDEEEEEMNNSGKWMIFPKGDLEKLDQYWLALIPLYKNGVLTRIKCSTAMGSEPGVINCYTANNENHADVKSAADAIRESVDYDAIMYYKTNEATARGLYQRFGSKNISKYMHTVGNCLYMREKFERWKLVSV